MASRFKLRSLLTVAAIALTASPAYADTALTPHKAQYKVKISVLGGQLNTQLSTTADGYVATHSIKATGMARMFARGEIKESSEFGRVPTGIRPEKYESNDTMSRDKGRASIQFDWVAGTASGKVNDEDFMSSMDDLAFDRVSIQYELMSDLMNGSPSKNYVLFDVDKLKTIEVRQIGTRTVKVPAGEFEAIGLEHQAVGSKRITTMWCVQELDYLPVIIEQHRKGDLKMRAVLSSYSPIKT
jgi:hypothetical protein